ncbi:hypothetical protein VSP9026_03663 [Vibrio spartinae]|uniref:Transposase n=1 Tax=Vibrio spartinae TaxID=1918945 RepID=A0A1N6M987_9VIBR|nr:hypothetical protein VSP9026_03663 [Vibrio spartinae]
MKCYNNSHPYYCGIDLHARLLYICILDSQANIIVHKKIAARQNSEPISKMDISILDVKTCT